MTRFFIVDSDAPSVSLSRDTDAWTNQPVQLLVTANDGSGSGIKSLCVDDGNPANGSADDCTATDVAKDGVFQAPPIMISAEVGQFVQRTVTATATDRLNNQTVETRTIKVDNAKPVITITPNDTTQRKGPVTVTVKANDAGSGLATLQINGTPVTIPTGAAEFTTTLPANVTDGTTGNFVVNATATDLAGNETVADPVAVQIDNALPTITFTPDSAQWTKGNVEVLVTATDVDSGVAELCVDGSCGAAATAKVSVTTATNGVVEQTINATARDRAGNVAIPASTTVRIDNAKPVVTIAKDPSAAWAKGNVKVTITATDEGSTLDNVCVRIDSGTCDTVTPANGKYEPITITADGTKVYTVEATDKAGNAADPKSTTVSIDTINPTATLSVTSDANADGIYNFGEAPTATFSCSDVGSGVASCALFDGDVQVATTSPSTINTSTTGARTLTVKATDIAGNTFTSPAKTLTVGFKTCLLSSSSQWNFVPIYTLRLTLCDEKGANKSASNIALTALAIDGTRDPIFNFSGLPLNYKFKYVSSGNYYEYTYYVGGLAKGAHTLSFTTRPVPSRNIGTVALAKLATNSAPFTLK